MISTRNATRTVIVGKHGVPVREVTESICERKSLDWITTRFPVTVTEVFECLDAIADYDKLVKGEHLKLENVSEEKNDLLIKVLQISDTCYLKILQFGKVHLPDSNDMEQLFDKGLLMIAYLSFKDIVENQRNFIDSDDLSQIVIQSFQSCCVDHTDESLYNVLKEQVEYETQV